MRWKLMMPTRIGHVLAAYSLTAVLYAILCVLAGASIDPVRFTSPHGDGALFRQHGMPVLSVMGAVIWLFIIAVYLAAMQLLLHRKAGVAPPRSILAFLLTLLIVAIVHPLLIPLLLPPAWRAPYVQLFELVHSPVGASRIGLNAFALLTVVSLVQAMLLCGIIFDRPGASTSRSPNFKPAR